MPGEESQLMGEEALVEACHDHKSGYWGSCIGNSTGSRHFFTQLQLLPLLVQLQPNQSGRKWSVDIAAVIGERKRQ